MRKIGALEAGGTKMVMAVLNENGEVMDRTSIPTRTPEETMPEMIEYFRAHEVDSLGVACFGPIDLRKNSPTYGYILGTPKLAWRNYDILGTFERALHVPTAFDTDVNGSAIGESMWGSAKDVGSCVYITIGTGIGIGVIVDGRPIHGALHPEGGHIALKRAPGDDFAGICPAHGDCFEGLCGGPAIEAHYGKAAPELADRADVWELESYYIAQAITNYILVLSPEKIILGGGVMKTEGLLPLIREKVLKLLNDYLQIDGLKDIDNYIVAPGLGDDQGIMGCAAMILRQEKEAK